MEETIRATRRYVLYDLVLRVAKECPQYPGYFVSKDGDVFATRKWKSKNRAIWMRPHPDEDGYFRLSISVSGKIKLVAVHTLVLLTHAGLKPREDFVCNHKNGRRWDNNIENLEWVSAEENERHAWKMGKETKVKRTKRGMFTTNRQLLDVPLIGSFRQTIC